MLLAGVSNVPGSASVWVAQSYTVGPLQFMSVGTSIKRYFNDETWLI